MRFLFVTSVIPYPPNNGIRVVPYNIIKILADQGHEVLLCSITDEDELGIDGLTNNERFLSLKKFVISDSFWIKIPMGTLFSRIVMSVGITPSFIKKSRNGQFRIKLSKCIDKYNPDIVHFDFINTTEYLDLVAARSLTVASVNDSMSLAMENRLKSKSMHWLKKLGKQFQLFQIKLYEAKTYPKFDLVHLMSDVDATYLRRLSSDINTKVIANGVDQSLFAVPPLHSDMSKVIFVGELRGNNLDAIRLFVANAWPKVLTEVPNAQLFLYGGISNSAENWLASLKSTTRVIAAGYVEHLNDAYEGASVSVVPIDKDSGIMNKIIEAMASGVPVVGFRTSFNAVKQAKEDEHFSAGDTFDELSSKVIRLLVDENIRNHLATNARQLARVNFSWSAKISEFNSMYGLDKRHD